MKKKRIAIVANSTWNIYKFRLNLIKRLLDNGNSVVVIAPLDEYISYKEEFPEVKHIALKNLSRNQSHPLKDFLAIFELSGIYRKIKPDVIIHYTHKANLYGGLAAFLNRRKSIAVITGLGYAFLHQGFINVLTRHLYKLVKHIHKMMVFENEDDMLYFINNGLVKSSKATFVNGCGVDTAVYIPAPKVLSVESKTTFTFIGRLLLDKGILEYVTAAKALKKNNPNLEFCIVGELDKGNPSMVRKELLLEWIDEGHITYLGFLDDVRPQMAHSDCIVLPSYREGMSRVVLEGLSMAKPIITTNVAGCRQTVEDGINGFLVKERDASSLIDGMEAFIRLSNQERKEMGEIGREIAIKNFNSEKISKELFEIVSQVYFCD